MARWVFSNNICNLVSLLMDIMFDDADEEDNDKQSKHKEQGMNRKMFDSDDKQKIRNEFKKYINPLHAGTDKLVKIVNGCIADDKIQWPLGRRQQLSSLDSLPECFYKQMHHGVMTMETMKKGVRVGEKVVVYDMEKLYGCLLVVGQK